MELQVQKREKLGGGVKALRNQGLIPAELYGKGLENFHLSVPEKEFKKLYKEAGESTIINVTLEGKSHPVLIQSVSFDPLTDNFQSVDFYQVRMDEKLTVSVPLVFEGVSLAVKEKNALLVKALQELEIEALPMNIPHDIKVDLNKLQDLDQSIYVRDLVIPANVEVLVSPDTVVATATEKTTEEEELAMQQAAAGGVESVKVETEEKKAEREAGKTVAEPESSAA
jgi:large subunit ribosomal protein L25